MSATTKSLSPAKHWLVQQMQQTNHGTMHNLIVRGGEPVLDPAPKIKRSYKLGSKRNAPKTLPRGFALKEQHLELFDLMDANRNGVITKLVIQDGLPFLVEWELD